jgi:TRAP-type mannitol/chloroaromatic compound transport system permease small subunit
MLLLLQGISEFIKRIAALRGMSGLVAGYEKPLQ